MTTIQRENLQREFRRICKRYDKEDELHDKAEADGDEAKRRRRELKREYYDGMIDGFRGALDILGIDLGMKDDGTFIVYLNL